MRTPGVCCGGDRVPRTMQIVDFRFPHLALLMHQRGRNAERGRYRCCRSGNEDVAIREGVKRRTKVVQDGARLERFAASATARPLWASIACVISNGRTTMASTTARPRVTVMAIYSACFWVREARDVDGETVFAALAVGAARSLSRLGAAARSRRPRTPPPRRSSRLRAPARSWSARSGEPLLRANAEDAAEGIRAVES